MSISGASTRIVSYWTGFSEQTFCDLDGHDSVVGYSPYILDSAYDKSLVIWTLFALLVTCPKLCILVLHWQLAMSVGFSFLFFYFTIA